MAVKVPAASEAFGRAGLRALGPEVRDGARYQAIKTVDTAWILIEAPDTGKTNKKRSKIMSPRHSDCVSSVECRGSNLSEYSNAVPKKRKIKRNYVVGRACRRWPRAAARHGVRGSCVETPAQSEHAFYRGKDPKDKVKTTTIERAPTKRVV